ncbi:hypothetical protein AGMMS50276_07630 [Synergistales bacterium]|nr:hypothetical protein AGMMS50276_07630 [Synergistales bacterium]
MQVDAREFLKLCTHGEPHEVEAAIKGGADVNAADDNGETVLMYAAENNSDSKVISLLLAWGADVSAVDNFNMTALDLVIECNFNREIVELLLGDAADAIIGVRIIDLKNSPGKIAISPLDENDIEDFSRLAIEVVDECLKAGYSEDIYKYVVDYASPESVAERRHASCCFVAKHKGEVVSVLEIVRGHVVSLFFVKKQFHNKGIGKALMNYSVDYFTSMEINVREYRVQASTYAENIYKSLGFEKLSDVQDRDGVKYIPMALQIKRVYC